MRAASYAPSEEWEDGTCPVLSYFTKRSIRAIDSAHSFARERGTVVRTVAHRAALCVAPRSAHAVVGSCEGPPQSWARKEPAARERGMEKGKCLKKCAGKPPPWGPSGAKLLQEAAGLGHRQTDLSSRRRGKISPLCRRPFDSSVRALTCWRRPSRIPPATCLPRNPGFVAVVPIGPPLALVRARPIPRRVASESELVAAVPAESSQMVNGPCWSRLM